jgi:multiple sugar transport system substrate-binding protein
VELTYWDAAWNEPITPDIVKEFETKNPGIKIKVQYNPDNGMSDKYLIALKQKAGPDIVNLNLDWIAPYAAAGTLQPLDPYVKADQLDTQDFYAGAMSTATYGGKIYALPYRTETHGLFFNKTLFTASGLDSSLPLANWDQALAAAKKITKDGVFGIGIPGTNFGNVTTQLFNMILSNGGSILTEDHRKSALTEPAAVEMAEFFVSLYKTKVAPGSVLENDNIVNRNLFTSKKIAMYMSGFYDIAPIKKADPALDFGTSMIPANKGRKTILAGWGTAVTSSSRHPEAAWKFVSYLASPEVSARYSITFSSRRSAAQNPKYQDPLVKPFIAALDYAQPLPQIPQLTQIKQIVFAALQGALAGKTTAAEAMKNASLEIDTLLAKQ